MNRIRQYCWSLLCLTGLLGGVSQSANATTNCSAAIVPISFGTIGLAGNTDVSATVTVTCNSFGLGALGTIYVRACLYLGTGTAGVSTAPRTMQNTFGDQLQYNVYQTTNFTSLWGDTAATRMELDLSYPVVLLAGNGTISRTFYARVPAQAGLAAGAYESSFAGIHTELRYRYDEPVLFLGSTWPTSCESGGDSGAVAIRFPFTATASVSDHCVFNTVTNLAFSDVVGSISANQDQTSTIGLTCTLRTPWQLGLNNGQNASGSIRRMRLGTTSNYVNYELYRNAGRTLRWGNTLDTDTLTGTGSGLTQTIDVFGRALAPQTAPAGNYKDVITVTMTF